MYLLPAHMAILHSLKRPKEILWRLWQPSRKFLISSKNHLEAVISVSVAETEENIGIVYMALGDYENSLLRYQKTREVKIRSYGTGHASVADTYNNIAIVEEKLGKFQQALELHEKALEIRKKALGDSHVSVAATKNNIGQALRK